MANDKLLYLVEHANDGELASERVGSIDEAIEFIRKRAEAGHFDCVLWQRVSFNVTVDVDVAGVTVPRTRKRKESTGAAAAEGAPPAPTKSAASVEVSEPVRAREQDGRAGAELRPAASLACGGARCREKGSIVIHDANDLSCGKLHPKTTAAR